MIKQLSNISRLKLLKDNFIDFLKFTTAQVIKMKQKSNNINSSMKLRVFKNLRLQFKLLISSSNSLGSYAQIKTSFQINKNTKFYPQVAPIST